MQVIQESLDAITEIVNIGVGRAASSLSDLIGERIELQVPSINMISLEEAQALNSGGMSILQGFKGELTGNALLVFPSESGRALAGLLAGYEETDDIQSIEVSSILSEVGNIVLNGVLGSIANILASSLDYDVPNFFIEEKLCNLIDLKSGDHADVQYVLVADTSFHVSSKDIQGTVLIAFDLDSLESVLTTFNQ